MTRSVAYTMGKPPVRTAGLILLGVVLTGTGFLVARSLIRKQVGKTEARGGMDKNAAASFAKRIHLAFVNDTWFGTDEVMLRKVLREIPSWEFYREVARSYEKQYRAVLENDLEAELSATEYTEMMEIIHRLRLRDGDMAGLVKSWYERLRSAWDVSCWIFPCTDEDAAYAVLKEIKQMPDPFFALRQLEAYYKSQSTSTLQQEAESEMEGEDLQTWNRLRNEILRTRTA